MDWNLFHPTHYLFFVNGYGLSLIEIIGTFFGLLSVWLGTRNHIGIWYAGFINVICFFVIFLSVGLYSDMLLQVFYFAITIIGIAKWKNNEELSLSISYSNQTDWIRNVVLCGLIFLLFMLFSTYAPLLLDFPEASFKTMDALLSSASVVATFMMAKRKIEAWLLWIVIDFVSVWMYIQKSVMLIGIEFLIFGVLAIVGYVQWRRVLKK